MKRVLIVYQTEGYHLFDLVVTPEQFDKMTACQNRFINSVDWPPECEWLAEFLDDYPPVSDSLTLSAVFPYFPPEKIDAVIVTGIVL